MEDDDELKAILKEAFGDSDDESMAAPETLSIFGDQQQIWDPINEVNGLWICRDFLSPDQQSSLLSALDKEGYFADDSHNQAMRFGNLPPWAIELSHYVRENVLFSGYSESTATTNTKYDRGTCVCPPELLWRVPLFDQLIVNIYKPGEGICAHVDLMRFEDGIAIISLESSCVMQFTSVEAEIVHCEETNGHCAPQAKIPVLLTPGSLILMSGEARYLWKHEINRKPGFQIWEGQEIDQKRRTSVTLRRLCQTE